MALELYCHPLASFCHKVLIALYENATSFEPVLVDLGDPDSRAAFEAVWPPAKMPVLRDTTRGCTVAESTIVIEYLDTHYRGPRPMLPADPDLAWQARMWDRVYDHDVQEPMQKIVGDRLRPAGERDPYGVAQAEAQLRRSYRLLDDALGTGPWALGEAFTLVDCSAAPALFYADTVAPFGGELRRLPGYLDRLKARPSFAQVLKEAEPYFENFPLERKPRIDGSGPPDAG